MDTYRIRNHPILGPSPIRQKITFIFNGKKLEGFNGEPIASALMANGVRVLRRHEETGSPRGLYCAIGHCMECRVNLKGTGIVRACITPLKDGMEVTEGKQLSNEITGREMP